MTTVADQSERLRRGLESSSFLRRVDLKAQDSADKSTALWHANLVMNAAGHELVAAQGPDALLKEVQQAAGAEYQGRMDLGFSTGGNDPWPDNITSRERMLPQIWSWLVAEDEHRLLIEVSTDLAWLEGHFPQTPILAGVVQLHLAALLARGVFHIDTMPSNIVRLKFQKPILPPALLEITLKHLGDQRVRFSCQGAGAAYSQGTLQFRTGSA